MRTANAALAVEVCRRGRMFAPIYGNLRIGGTPSPVISI